MHVILLFVHIKSQILITNNKNLFKYLIRLKNIKMSLPILTKEQRDKLASLEKELADKKRYEETHRERKLATSKRTGIPYNLIDTDAVRIGTLLGLIKSLDILEGTSENSGQQFSLLDLFFGADNDAPQYDYGAVPPYFSIAHKRISEDEKVRNHRQYIALECQTYCGMVTSFLQHELAIVKSAVSIIPNDLTVDSFTLTILENLEIVLESLRDEDDDELWDQLKILRNSQLSVMDICDYKNLLTSQISTLIAYEKPMNKIAKHLSYVDVNLSLFPGFQSVAIDNLEIVRVHRQLTIRSHIKNPELKPFNMKDITKECCVPSLMFVPVQKVLESGIIGPYRNDPICFAGFTSASFYVMKCVTGGGIRMWILDEQLTMFSEKLRHACLSFCIKLFKTYFLAFTGSNNYSTVWTECEIMKNLLTSISWLACPDLVRTHICKIVAQNSPLIATELDVFDEIPTRHCIVNLSSRVNLPEPLFNTQPCESFDKKWNVNFTRSN
jgi:hypothetical protein